MVDYENKDEIESMSHELLDCKQPTAVRLLKLRFLFLFTLMAINLSSCCLLDFESKKKRFDECASIQKNVNINTIEF